MRTLLILTVFLLHSCTPKTSVKVLENKEYSIKEVQDAFISGEYSVRDLVSFYLDRIEKIDQAGPKINAVIQINPDALAIADSLDQLIRAGQVKGKMFGVPVLLKDNIDTKDKMYTTAGSRALANSKPLQDSWVAAALRKEGAVILGKANLSEWANFRGKQSSSGWSGVGGQTKNPYVLDRNPCGSSAGSGAAVAANLCIVAIGTETNGSIVCPSTSNGIVGIKPTVGLISRVGIIPISYTQDTPGPMARTVEDAAICLESLIGVDPNDLKTRNNNRKLSTKFISSLNSDALSSKRIAYYTASKGINKEVDKLMDESIEILKSKGAVVIELDSIFSPEAYGHSFNVMKYEFKEGLNQYLKNLGAQNPIQSLTELISFNLEDSVELMHFGQELLIECDSISFLDAEAYLNSLKSMKELTQKDGIDRVFESLKLDAIIAPTGGPAWKTDHENGDKFELGSSSPAAISGYPNITVPMGFVGDLPVGISFFGQAWTEEQLIAMVYSYEQATTHRRAPKFLKN